MNPSDLRRLAEEALANDVEYRGPLFLDSKQTPYWTKASADTMRAREPQLARAALALAELLPLIETLARWDYRAQTQDILDAAHELSAMFRRIRDGAP
jgi:hypothetical protein